MYNIPEFVASFHIPNFVRNVRICLPFPTHASTTHYVMMYISVVSICYWMFAFWLIDPRGFNGDLNK